MSPRDFFSDLPVIRTPRLILRKLSLEDAADMFAYARDPAMTRYTPWAAHQCIDDSRGFLTEVMNKYEHGQPADFGIVLQSTGRLIGTCGIVNFNDTHERGELGYAIGADHWGRGYMTEAAAAVVDAAFRALRMTRLQSCCNVENVGSYRVMEKLGMTFDGIFRRYFKIAGQYHDVRFYSLLRDEHDARQASSSRII
jgi:ribosomal-protein-alanine N-acetyltransferase